MLNSCTAWNWSHEDRRGRDPAGSGDRDDSAQAVAQRIALQHALETRDEDEDRNHGGEGELEAGVEQRVRIPPEKHDRSDEQEMPPVGDARRQPCNDGQRARDAGAHDGRLCSDRNDVRHDRRERAELADDA